MRMTKRLLVALLIGIGSDLACLAICPYAVVDCLYVMLAAILYLEATK
jgi:hypothetical protein